MVSFQIQFPAAHSIQPGCLAIVSRSPSFWQETRGNTSHGMPLARVFRCTFFELTRDAMYIIFVVTWNTNHAWTKS
jgi:hypothetical protein